VEQSSIYKLLYPELKTEFSIKRYFWQKLGDFSVSSFISANSNTKQAPNGAQCSRVIE
jgi:hypothetical protein